MTNRIFGFAQIVALELDESLIASNLKTDANGNYRMDVRCRFQYENTQMTDEEKELYDKLSDKQKKVLKRLGRNDTYTCLFSALDLLDADDLGGIDNYNLIKEMLSTDGIDEETQKKILTKCVDVCKDGKDFIPLPFTTYVVPIVDVLKDTEYQTGKGKDGKTFDFTSIHSDTRGYSSVSRSYFGNHTDIENATNGIIRRTLKRLDDGTYRVGNTDSESDLLVVAESSTTEKPKLTL